MQISHYSSRNLFPAGIETAVFLIIMLTLASCSSLPKGDRQVVESQNRAAGYARFGNQYFAEGNLSKALDFFRLALEENQSIDNETGIAKTYYSIGKVHLSAENLEEAENAFSHTREIAERTGRPQLLMYAYSGSGELAMARNDPARALELFESSLGEARQLSDDPKWTAIALHNVGTALSRLGKLDDAETRFQAAAEINTQENRYRELASNHYMLASIYSRRTEYQKAEVELQTAMKNDKIVENSLGIAQDLRALGMVQEKSGNLETALDYYQRSLQVYVARGQRAPTVALLGVLERVASSLGMNDLAATYNEQLRRLTQGE